MDSEMQNPYVNEEGYEAHGGENIEEVMLGVEGQGDMGHAQLMADESVNMGDQQVEGQVGDVSDGDKMNANRTKDEGKFFLGGIHPEAQDDELRRHFQRFGDVLDIHIMKDTSTGRNRGFGFVTMKTKASKQLVFQKEHILRNKRMEVREMQNDVGSNLRRKIFVGGIGIATTEDQLEEYFSQFGKVEKVTVMKDVEGKSRGFGFVVFFEESTMKKVISKALHYLESGTKVEVRPAEARTKLNMIRNLHRPRDGPWDMYGASPYGHHWYGHRPGYLPPQASFPSPYSMYGGGSGGYWGGSHVPAFSAHPSLGGYGPMRQPVASPIGGRGRGSGVYRHTPY